MANSYFQLFSTMIIIDRTKRTQNQNNVKSVKCFKKYILWKQNNKMSQHLVTRMNCMKTLRVSKHEQRTKISHFYERL